VKKLSQEGSWIVSGLLLVLLVGCTSEAKKVSLAPAPTEMKIEIVEKIEKKTESFYVVAETLKPVFFDLQKSKLSESALTTAKENVTWLKTQPPYLIEIVGVADQRGSTARNKTLAERRAKNLKDFYVAEGIPSERIMISAMEEDTEACPKMDEECLKFSRRADTKLEPKALAQR